MTAVVDGKTVDRAELVGQAFVHQFYHILHETPTLVHRFFHNSSTMTRPGPDGTLKVANTVEEINDLILSLDCKYYKSEILTTDSQASHRDGMIVLVTGCLIGKNNMRRKFVESFFLAPQIKGYFVLNNAFRFVVTDNLPTVEVVEDEFSGENSSVEVVEDEVFGENSSVEVVEYEVSSENSSVEVVEYESSGENSLVEVVEDKFSGENSSVEVQGDQSTMVDVPVENRTEPSNLSVNKPTSTIVGKEAPSAPVASSNNAQAITEVLSNGHVDAPKKSWASLLKNTINESYSSLVHATTRAARPAAQQPVASPVAGQSSPDQVPATAPASSVSSGSNMNGSGPNATEDKGHSIYVGDLPTNATVELVEEEFKQFGPIKRGGVQVRENKGYYFGFVEYEDASAQQKAVQMGVMMINGKRAFIEEKKASTQVVNGTSTYPSGQGGYLGDGFRDQGNYYSKGRSYSQNEHNRHNGGPQWG